MSQREALETTIAAGQGTLGDRHAALVELCRVLADQMDDAAGDAGPSGRVVASYLSALKDLGRALGNAATRSTGGKLAGLRAAAEARRLGS